MTVQLSAPFTLAQITSLGLTRSQLRGMVDDGLLRRPVRGVYCPAELEDTIELRAACASLVLPAHSVVCDRSAAWLHGIDTLSLVEKTFPPDLEVISLRGHNRTRREGVYGGRRDLLPDDICMVGDVRATTPLRTACDLACLRGPHSSLAVLDAFMRHHQLSRADFDRMLPRYRRRRGCVQLRRLIPLASPDRESTGESFTAVVIAEAGLPQPAPQVWVEVEGFGAVRLDHAYKQLKIAIEYDGEEHHTSTVDREHDHRRRAALVAAGWIVIVVRKADLAAATSGRWLAELRAALDERTPRHRRTYPRGSSLPPRV